MHLAQFNKPFTEIKEKEFKKKNGEKVMKLRK